MIVFSMAILLMASLAVMLYYSRKAVKEEATQKAAQTLEGVTQHIDNTLLSVELATGNIFFSMLPHLNNPEMMYTYSRQLVESNHFIAGCAIALKPDFYKDRKYFMAYVHRGDSAGMAYADSKLVTDEFFGHRLYTEQDWYKKPMTSDVAGWLNPNTDEESKLEPIITFCLPIRPKGEEPVGVLGVDVSLSLLSKIVAEAKPSANSYCTLLDKDGSYIIHPNINMRMRENALTLSEKSAKEAAQAMVSGETGYKPFSLNGKDYYVFYKPFKRTIIPGRTIEDLGWSAGIVYPEDDIFGDYNSLLYYVLGIAMVGLLVLFLLTRWMIRRQLRPLQTLSETAQSIAEGGGFRGERREERGEGFRATGGQKDEIGRLQDNFMLMQRSLAKNIGELEELTETLRERGEGLRRAYVEAQKADRMKTAFLHNMTNQMIEPSNAINACVDELVAGTRRSNDGLADEIEANGHRIADLLENLIHMSDEEGSGNGNNGKEVGYV
jgi:sensor histidine kinase YesM